MSPESRTKKNFFADNNYIVIRIIYPDLVNSVRGTGDICAHVYQVYLDINC
jgi:hypothetical protein